MYFALKLLIEGIPFLVSSSKQDNCISTDEYYFFFGFAIPRFSSISTSMSMSLKDHVLPKAMKY